MNTGSSLADHLAGHLSETTNLEFGIARSTVRYPNGRYRKTDYAICVQTKTEPSHRMHFPCSSANEAKRSLAMLSDLIGMMGLQSNRS